MMMIKLRGQLFALIAVLFVSFAAHADPKDYPPTAFQLAQICHYSKNEDVVREALCTSVNRFGFIQAAQAREKLQEKASMIPAFLSEAEDYIKSYIANPLEADEAEWNRFFDAFLHDIQDRRKGDDFVESFDEKLSRGLIVKAIMQEQNAMKRGEVILWRAGKETAEAYKLKGEHESFSLGLFSGFIFDGFEYHHKGFTPGFSSACTYTYLSGFLYLKRLILEARSGVFYAKVRAIFPEFFIKYTDWPQPYQENYSLGQLIESIRQYYMLQLSASLDEFDAKIMPLNKERFTFTHKIRGVEEIKEISKFCIFGVCLTQDELKLRRELSKADAVNNKGKRLQKTRGEFLEVEHAVYGRGEFFHPKEKIPDAAEIVHLYDYPAVDIGGAAGATTASGHNDNDK